MHCMLYRHEQWGGSSMDIFPLLPLRHWQRLKTRVGCAPHLGNIIQIPICWIFDDAGKGNTGVEMVKGWDMGRETRRWRCSFTGACFEAWPNFSKCLKTGGSNRCEIWWAKHYSKFDISAEWYQAARYFISSGRQTQGVRLSWWRNTSITHIPCESVSACGRKREGANLIGREGKKECPEIPSCDICFFPVFI